MNPQQPLPLPSPAHLILSKHCLVHGCPYSEQVALPLLHIPRTNEAPHSWHGHSLTGVHGDQLSVCSCAQHQAGVQLISKWGHVVNTCGLP